MRSIGVTLGLLLGLGACQGKGPERQDLECVEQPCADPAAADECRCDPGMICEAGHCQACTDASQCESGICHPSGRCEPSPCAIDEHCPIAEICDGGQCVHRSPDANDQADAICGIAALYFAADSAKLTPNNQERLSMAAPCLGELLAAGGTLTVEAHDDGLGVDGLGGDEYSLDLTERRAASVREFLVGVGLPADRIRMIGKGAVDVEGDDESARAERRRVQLTVGR